MVTTLAAADTTHAEVAATDTIRIELEGRYAGWWAECDADPDWAFLEDLSAMMMAGQFGPAGKALVRVIVRWNFQAKDGTAAPASLEGLRLVPARSVLALASTYLQRWGELPNQRGVA